MTDASKARKSRRRGPTFVKPSPELPPQEPLNGEVSDLGPSNPLTDGQMVSVLAQQLSTARLLHFTTLQKFAAKKVEANELSWDDATAFIHSNAAAFDGAVQRSGQQLMEEFAAKGQQEGHS